MHDSTRASNIVPGENLFFTRGWIVIGAAFLGMFFTGPGQTYFIAIFIDSIIAEFGWSRTMVSTMYSAATSVSGILMILMGRVIDRYGARHLSILAIISLGIGCLTLSFVINPAMLFIGFFIGRLSGQGTLGTAIGTVPPQWFVRRRALAIMIVGLGNTVASSVFPLLNHWLIDALGWRTALRWVGSGLWLVALPLVAIFLRSRPEDIGLLPDGNTMDTAKAEDSAPPPGTPPAPDFTQGEAIRTASLWLLAYAFFQFAMVGTGISFHFISIFRMQGYSDGFAAGVMSISPVAGVTATILVGSFLDRVKRPQIVLAVACAIQVFTKIMLTRITSDPAAYAYALLSGSSSAVLMLCIGVLKPWLFGRRYMGGISGVISVTTVLGSAIGPLYFGAAFDITGGYHRTLLISAVFPALACIGSLLIRKPVKVHLSV